MKITGSCHCGAISYEAEVDAGAVIVCHCTDCQTLSGSAFRVVVPAKRFYFPPYSFVANHYFPEGGGAPAAKGAPAKK